MPIAFRPDSGNNWKESVSLIFFPSHDMCSVMGDGGWDVTLLRHPEPTRKRVSAAGHWAHFSCQEPSRTPGLFPISYMYWVKKFEKWYRRDMPFIADLLQLKLLAHLYWVNHPHFPHCTHNTLQSSFPRGSYIHAHPHTPPFSLSWHVSDACLIPAYFILCN